MTGVWLVTVQCTCGRCVAVDTVSFEGQVPDETARGVFKKRGWKFGDGGVVECPRHEAMRKGAA